MFLGLFVLVHVLLFKAGWYKSDTRTCVLIWFVLSCCFIAISPWGQVRVRVRLGKTKTSVPMPSKNVSIGDNTPNEQSMAAQSHAVGFFLRNRLNGLGNAPDGHGRGDGYANTFVVRNISNRWLCRRVANSPNLNIDNCSDSISRSLSKIYDLHCCMSWLGFLERDISCPNVYVGPQRILRIVCHNLAGSLGNLQLGPVPWLA
jgi:hypothetical protein